MSKSPIQSFSAQGIYASGIKNRIQVSAKSGAYEVVLCDGEMELFLDSYSRVLLVSNDVVGGLYLQDFLKKIHAAKLSVCILPDGENHKNWTQIEKILKAAFEARLDRKSLMIALGGGVISDMVGFASGIYQRGIDFISVPTTLLAQVDASVGGKCGINNEYGKNLIGLFHQPSAVFVQMKFLQSLKARELRAGLAEIVKIAICFDKGLFEDLEREDEQNLEEWVRRAIAIKAHVVECDEHEMGLRAGLNYGHTFGHVIELLGNYQTYLHGEAVSIGMQMANELAVRLGYLSQSEQERIHRILQKFQLIFPYKILDASSFYEKFFLDKKTEFGRLKLIVPRGIGGVEILKNVREDIVLEVLGKWS